MSENLTSRQARALVLLPAKRPRCTMDNVTLFEGDDGQVPDVQAANTGPQRRGPAPALLLRRLQAARLPAGLQGAAQAATKPAPRGKIRYHEAAITTDILSVGTIHTRPGIWPISPIGESQPWLTFLGC
jgi:hypothetical protein